MKKEKMANSEDIRRMIEIVEDFLRNKKRICYGGTAINNILPKEAQFYDKRVEIPDYDFFSPYAIQDAKELADLYFKSGYEHVEAKSGVHRGTYKVFVNFIPMADITYLDKKLYKSIEKEAILMDGIQYAPANFLRMNMYLELSRPAGDVSRWEKVLKRLTLLNKYYPLKPDIICDDLDFQRPMEENIESAEDIYNAVRDTFIDNGAIFIGAYASSLYSRYMPEKQRRQLKKIPDFDVLFENAEKGATLLCEKLERLGLKRVAQIKHDCVGEIVPKHIEIKIGKDTIAYLYEPIACHNYNEIQIQDRTVRIATIDTMLSFYLAFYYADQPYYHRERILCMSKFLFNVERENRLAQKGLLKRFSVTCYGKQETLENIRAEKTSKFKELKTDKMSQEYNEWFFKYVPCEKSVGQKLGRIPCKTTTRRNIEKTPTPTPKKRTYRKLPKLLNYLLPVELD